VNQNNLTKKELIKNLSKKTGFSLLYSKKLVNDFFEALIQNIIKNNFNLKNIGTFKVINKKERIGRNPKTKEIFTINSRKSLSFIASNNLLDILNKHK
jgi:integration host factor subunit alpha